MAEGARPVLVAHPQYMAIRGLPAFLRERRYREAADAIEAISNGYEAGEHLAVVDRETLLAHNTAVATRNRRGKKRRHGRPAGR